MTPLDVKVPWKVAVSDALARAKPAPPIEVGVSFRMLPVAAKLVPTGGRLVLKL